MDRQIIINKIIRILNRTDMCEPVLMEIGRTIEVIERRTVLENRIAEKKNQMGDKELDIRVIPDKKKQQVL